MSQIELPLGFGMALAQNEQAMKEFESFSEKEKLNIIEMTHNISSKSEMKMFVNNLANRKDF